MFLLFYDEESELQNIFPFSLIWKILRLRSLISVQTKILTASLKLKNQQKQRFYLMIVMNQGNHLMHLIYWIVYIQQISLKMMVKQEFKTLLTFLEKFLQLLMETNDKAASNINKGNCKESLQILEKMEKLLEVLPFIIIVL